MPETLKIAGLGMVSSLGVGSEYNAAAMRCHYDGFTQVDSHTVDNENLLVSKVELKDSYRGNKRLAKLMQMAMDEAMEKLPKNEQVPLYVCLPEQNPLLGNTKTLSEHLREELKATHYAAQINYQQSTFFSLGRVAFAHACQQAQQQLNEGQHKYILIIAVDTLLHPQIINYYQSQYRILQTDNSDAFIPGEAAVAVLLTNQATENNTEIQGIGISEESGYILSDQPVTGAGLTNAVNQAAKKAGIAISDTAFRISTASGENYFFKELTIVHGRIMNNPRQDHPLWHPADSIGEVGAASTAAMVVMAHYAFKKGYAPGDMALCQSSNDNQHRAAFIILNTSQRNPHNG